MLLSQVKCGDHRKIPSPINRERASQDIEIIGPVQGGPVASLRNRGARLARGRWLLFTDGDCQVNFQDVNQIIESIETQNLAFVAIGGFYREASPVGLWQGAYHCLQKLWVERGFLRESRGGFTPAVHLLGGALLVRRDVFLALGGFNEDLGWGSEECEWVQRLQNQSYETAVCRDWWVTHHNRLSFLGFLRRAWVQNRNRTQWSTDLPQATKSPLIYLRGPLPLLPWMLMFFFTAGLASLWGSVLSLRAKPKEALTWNS